VPSRDWMSLRVLVELAGVRTGRAAEPSALFQAHSPRNTLPTPPITGYDHEFPVVTWATRGRSCEQGSDLAPPRPNTFLRISSRSDGLRAHRELTMRPCRPSHCPPSTVRRSPFETIGGLVSRPRRVLARASSQIARKRPRTLDLAQLAYRFFRGATWHAPPPSIGKP